MIQDNYQYLLEQIDNFEVFDTHEHIRSESERVSKELDVFNLFEQYAFFDAIAAGLPFEKMRMFVDDKTIPLEERWNDFRDYWRKIRNTSYSESVLIAIKDLLNFDDLNDATYKSVSQKLNEVNVKGWYKKVLKDICHIKMIVLDVDAPTLDEQLNVDRELFIPVARFDHYLDLTKRSNIERIERETGISIHSLDNLLKAFEKLFSKAIQAKVCAIKIGMAYQRSVKIDKWNKMEAESDLNYLLKDTLVRIPWLEEKCISYGDITRLQDFCIHYIIELAYENDLPVQIHTGLQEGYGNYLINSNPLLIVNLLLEYKNVKFVIFHGGYPFLREAISIAKNFQNAFLDMCWLHVISRKAAKDFLEEAIEVVPINKIFGFGGDYPNVEGTYGHLKIAKQNISKVFAKCIDEGRFNREFALKIAEMILKDNPSEFYRI
jgi:hypothetical protein